MSAYGVRAPEGLSCFPTPQAVAAADPEELRTITGVTRSRSRTLQALATACVEGLELDPGADRDETRHALLALPGVGRWTADYVALRCLGDPDAFPAGDLVLRRALNAVSARQAGVRSAAWRPWRGYAALHLWTSQALSGCRTPRSPG